jgi:hypothetical protein
MRASFDGPIAVRDQETRHPLLHDLMLWHCTVAYQRAVQASEHKLAKFMASADEQLSAADGCPLKAVFVTFNSQAERDACQRACPRRECACFAYLCYTALLQLVATSWDQTAG